MPLDREQYNKLMLEYSMRRDAHSRDLASRKAQVYAKIPEYHNLDQRIPDLCAKDLEDRLSGRGSDGTLSTKLQQISTRKSELLCQNGFPRDYLSPQYDCPDCRDTGYINGSKCHCLRRRELHLLYLQSHLDQLLETNNFDLLRRDFYQGEDLKHFESALNSCLSFIKNFENNYENLFFYGTVGTGKSFLTISTAGELLKKGCSVLYFSAAALFEELSARVFQADKKSEYRGFTENLYHCDLLIIDDLGTEVVNNFVASQLFSLLTEREISQKSIVISTNLSLPELQGRYSDRIFSRITSNFTVRKLTGPDIRIARKMQHRS